MLVFEKGLYYFVGVGLFFGFAFQMVKCKSNDCQKADKESKCKVIYNCDASREMMTWEQAKTYCSNHDESLLDFSDGEDLQYIKNISVSDLGIWVGLKKNASNLTEILANMDDLFKIRECESANINGHLIRNESCTDNLLPSVCVKTPDDCKNRSKRNNSRCFLSVYDRMTYFGASAHCKRLNSTLYTGNFSKDSLFNTSENVETSLFWTGKLYESNIDAGANWTWLNGSLFKEWDKWKIIITDVGCGGCSFVKNGTVYLTSNCSQTYFCDIVYGLDEGQMSWKDAKSRCSRLQFPTSNNTLLMNTGNKSYWLGIYRKDTCKTHMVEDPASVTELRLKRCRYVGNSNDMYGEQDCNEKIHAVCVKSAETNCLDPWQHFRESCYRIERSHKSWNDARDACNDHGGKLVKIDDEGEENFICDEIKKRSSNLTKRFWIGLKASNNGTWRCNCSFHQLDENAKYIQPRKGHYVMIKDTGGLHVKPRCKKLGFICEKKADLTCPNHWNLANNGFCWLVFDKVQMTWQAAHTFCLQHDSRLANSTDIQVINRTSLFLNDGRRYWMNSAQIKVYPPKDPLQGWYWLDGRQFNASNRRGLYRELSYTGEEERCAMIRDSKNGIWKDSPCGVRRSFICKKKEFINSTNRPTESEYVKGKILESVRRLLPYKLNISDLMKFKVLPPAYNKTSLEETLLNVTKEVIGLVNSSSFNESFKESMENFLVVEVSTTSLQRPRQKRNNTMSTPIMSIGNACQKQTNCTVKKVTIQLKDVLVNCSHLWDLSPFPLADIIVLDYIANRQLLWKLEKNETVFLNFSIKLRSFTSKQVNCLFLDGDQWSIEGMKFGSIGENIGCFTDHLSSFTMVVLDTEVSDDSNKVALNIIYYIGSALSLTGLVFSCIVYIVLYKDLQILTTSRHLVHFNLQIALGLTQIVFLAGGSATQDEVACKVVAILVNYFSLAGFTWILLEAAMLYLKLISVYGGEFVRMKNFLLFGWGFPLLFVGLSAGVKIDAYGTDQWCWLSYEDGFLWVFFAPVIIMTSVTLVTVIAVVRVLFIASKSEEADAKKTIISAARGVVVLFPTLGLSWGFSVIAVNHDALVWKYLFAIFTSLQGFLIFLIYGVCNTEIRRAVGRKMGYDVHPATSTT